MRVPSRPSHATVVSYLALFVAMTGTTYAATGGNFILGQANSAGAVTQLTANLSGKTALKLINTNTGAGATALSLNVASGRSPFVVNSSTKVTNLNADKLDGYDSSAFLRGRMLNAWLSRGGPSTKMATVGGYDISAQCFDDVDDSRTVVWLQVKGPAGLAEAVWSAVNGDYQDVGNFSRAEGLPANVNTVIMAAFAFSGYQRVEGSAIVRSNSGTVVYISFTALAWDDGAACGMWGTATTG